MDARLDFDQVERLADEILCAGLQRAQLVAGLGGDHEDRKVAVRVVGLEAFHHLEAVHAGHLQVEQDQVVAVLAMQRADLVRIHGRGDARVAGLAQHLLEQADIGLLVVDDQDAGVENVRLRQLIMLVPLGLRGPMRVLREFQRHVQRIHELVRP